MAGTWLKVLQKGMGPGARSSHAIAVVGRRAYAFGGEFTPRVPVDNDLHVLDLKDGAWSVAKAVGDVPPPRVGVTMAALGETIYVFGGRDADHKELNELYSFDISASEWTLLSSGEVGPPHRSYHSMAADRGRVYVFGGCGNAGRLKDLWAFDVEGRQWVELPAPGESFRPRGGPGLEVCGGKVWVVYGFSGEELDDVHCFDPIDETGRSWRPRVTSRAPAACSRSSRSGSTWWSTTGRWTRATRATSGPASSPPTRTRWTRRRAPGGS